MSNEMQKNSKKILNGNAMHLAVVSVVVGLLTCLIVWVPYYLTVKAERAVADIALNGSGNGNEGVVIINFVLTIFLEIVSFSGALGAILTGVGSVVSSVIEKRGSGKQVAVPLALSIVGILVGLALLVVCCIVACQWSVILS